MTLPAREPCGEGAGVVALESGADGGAATEEPLEPQAASMPVRAAKASAPDAFDPE